MKTISIVFIVLTITNLGFSSFCKASDNYLMLRYEYGRDVDLDRSFSERYAVFENNSLARWSFGTKLVSGENGFKLINPHTFFRLTPNFHIGGKYSAPFIGNASAGPAIRYKGVLWKKIFTIFDATQYLNLEESGGKTDLWLHISQAKKQGWYCGAEIWYYNIKSEDNLKLRPIKIGYKLTNGLAPFIMIQRHWNNGNHKSDSVLGGIEIIF